MKHVVSCALAVTLLAACSKDFGPTAPEEPGSRIVVRAYNEISSGSGGVRTDKDDYLPGETVTILGAGWEPGETVLMALTEDPDVQQDLVLTSVADAQGNFVNTEFAVSDIHLGTVFTLSAEGQSSGMTASTMFNDGNLQLQPNPTPNPFSPNADGIKETTTISWRITGSGSETNVTISIRQGALLSGTLVRTFAIGNKNPGDSGTVSWDGTNTSSVVVSDGVYTARIFSTSQPETGATGGQRIASLIVDKVAPVISSPAVSPNSVATGSNTPVTVTGTATDTPASGVAASNYKIVSAEFNVDGGAFSPMTAAGGGFNSNVENVSGMIPGTTVAGLSAGTHPVCIRATDDAGNRSANNAPSDANCATLTVISPDNTGPTVLCTVPDQSVWYDDDVTVSCTASDASGLQDPADAAFSLSTDVPGGTETASAQTGSREVCDTLGNCTTAGPYSFQVDKKAPSTSCAAPDGQWHPDDVSIACTATDGGSGVAPSSDESFLLTTDVPDGTETSNAATGSKTVSDLVGNQATAGPINGNMVDKKAPQISCGSADGVWHPDDVSIACTATDGGSGVTPSSDESFSLTTDVPDGTETSNAATGSKTVSDLVGNQATAGPIDGNMIDKKAPGISCQVPGPSFTLNQTPANVNATASDGGSGPATQNVSAAANTSSVGIHQVGLSATDAVGNTGNKNCGYSVLYAFSGYYQPVDNMPTMNVAKAGQAVPLKWRLQDFFGAPVLNLTLADVEVKTLNCSNGEGTDQVEQYAGASGLQNLGDGYYQYNWKSPKAYAGACKSLNLYLGEGSTHNAFFQFKN